MKRRARTTLQGFVALLVAVVASLPGLAHACPMCFAGGDQNQDAFLYGSLFLMIVPVVAIGGLGYWAYRRIRAIDEGTLPERADAEGHPEPASGAATVVLHIAPRR